MPSSSWYRNGTAGRRGRQNARVWQTYQGYYFNLHILLRSSLNINFSGLLQNDLFKERWSLEKSYFKQNYSHACHTRLAVFFPLQSCCVSSQMTFSTSNNSLDNFTCWYAQFWKKQTTYPMRGWCSLQICISRRLLWLLPLVLYCHNGYEKYWQPSRPRTHANNTSIVKICPEQLVWASSLNTLSSFHYFPKFWSVSVPLEKKKTATKNKKSN